MIYDTWVREFEKVSGAHEKMIVATKKFYADNIKALTSLQTVYICSVGANMVSVNAIRFFRFSSINSVEELI